VTAPKVTRFLQGLQRRGFELTRAVRIFVELMRGGRPAGKRRQAEIGRMREFRSELIRGAYPIC
jgi:hypothetical protein